MTMWTYIAVVPAKPSTQGETKTQTPTTRLSNSSQTVNAANAAIDIAAMTIPLTTAFCDAAPLGKPKIQGDAKRINPRIRLATSQSLALLHSFMTSSFCTSTASGVDRADRSIPDVLMRAAGQIEDNAAGPRRRRRSNANREKRGPHAPAPRSSNAGGRLGGLQRIRVELVPD